MPTKEEFKPREIQYAIENQRTGRLISKRATVKTQKQLDKIYDKAIKIYGIRYLDEFWTIY